MNYWYTQLECIDPYRMQSEQVQSLFIQVYRAYINLNSSSINDYTIMFFNTQYLFIVFDTQI